MGECVRDAKMLTREIVLVENHWFSEDDIK